MTRTEKMDRVQLSIAIALLILGYRHECDILYNISAGIFLGRATAYMIFLKDFD